MMISREDSGEAYRNWEIVFSKIEDGKIKVLNVVIDDNNGKVKSAEQSENHYFSPIQE